MTLSAFLSRVVAILEEAEAPYMLTGSLAAASYASPRATQDIDFVVDLTPERLEDVVRRLLAAGLYLTRNAARARYIQRWVERLGLGDEWRAILNRLGRD